MTLDETAIHRLLLWVVRTEEVAQLKGSYPEKLLPLRESLAGTFRPCTFSQLEGLLRKSNRKLNLDDHGTYIFLDPIAKEAAVPVVSFNFDFSVDPPELRIRVAVFGTLDRKGSTASATRSIAFRLEPAEGTSGVHSYPHLQLISGFTKDSASIPGIPNWMPDSLPAWPLDSRGPFALLCCLLIGLYGAEYVNAMNGFDYTATASLLTGCHFPWPLERLPPARHTNRKVARKKANR